MKERIATDVIYVPCITHEHLQKIIPATFMDARCFSFPFIWLQNLKNGMSSKTLLHRQTFPTFPGCDDSEKM